MKSRSLLASFATLIALTAAPAMAADMRAPVKAPPPVVAPTTTGPGFYIGAHVGGARGNKDWFDARAGNLSPTGFERMGSHDLSGVIAGGQIGYNWQAPGSNWVFGIEGQGVGADLKGDHIFVSVERGEIRFSKNEGQSGSPPSLAVSAMPGIVCCFMPRAALRSWVTSTNFPTSAGGPMETSIQFVKRQDTHGLDGRRRARVRAGGQLDGERRIQLHGFRQ